MDKKVIDELLNYISPSLRRVFRNLSPGFWNTAEEIHIGIEKPAIIYVNGGCEIICDEKGAFICTEQTIAETLMLITENSIYAANERLTNGFITLKGGHRAGVCGTAVIKDNKVSAIKDISSINIRIKREIKNAANGIMKYITKDGIIKNTLIISPPRAGKTTLLRDIARVLGSNYKVAIVDERSEIAAMYKGVPQNDVGIHTDILDSCKKHIGIPQVIRSMSPQVVIADEIGAEADIEAINYAVNSGVKVITTAHGADNKDLMQRRYFPELLGFFDVFVILSSKNGTGTVEKIIRKSKNDI